MIWNHTSIFPSKFRRDKIFGTEVIIRMQKLGTWKIAFKREHGTVKAGFGFTSLTETGLARFVSRTLFNPLSHHREWPTLIFSQHYYSKDPKSVTCFCFIHILSYKFNPIRSQLETVVDLWLVNVCMKECELIRGGHTFGLLAVMPN